MLSKSIEKYVNSLKQKKYRYEEGRFIAEGEKLAEDLLRSHLRADKIIATTDWLETHQPLWDDKKSTVIEVSAIEMKKISGLVQPSSVMLILEMDATAIDEEKVKTGLNLVLEGVQDPGNMGTIIRIADWFGIASIFCSEDCVDVYNPKVVQASMGSVGRVPAMELPLNELFVSYPSLPAYAMQLEGESIFESNLKPDAFIVIGNEARGISASLTPYIHKRLTIPKFGQAESLNAAVAAGITCAIFRMKH